jgi:hypothetical protein
VSSDAGLVDAGVAGRGARGVDPEPARRDVATGGAAAAVNRRDSGERRTPIEPAFERPARGAAPAGEHANERGA